MSVTSSDHRAMDKAVKRVFYKRELDALRMRRSKIQPEHFQEIERLGTGAFGHVNLVRYMEPGTTASSCGAIGGGLYAMKVLNKAHILKKDQVCDLYLFGMRLARRFQARIRSVR